MGAVCTGEYAFVNHGIFTRWTCDGEESVYTGYDGTGKRESV